MRLVEQPQLGPGGRPGRRARCAAAARPRAGGPGRRPAAPSRPSRSIAASISSSVAPTVAPQKRTFSATVRSRYSPLRCPSRPTSAAAAALVARSWPSTRHARGPAAAGRRTPAAASSCRRRSGRAAARSRLARRRGRAGQRREAAEHGDGVVELDDRAIHRRATLPIPSDVGVRRPARRVRALGRRSARPVGPTAAAHDWRWVVGGIGKVLIATGLLMFGFVAYQLWGTGIEYAQAQNQLDDEFEELLASDVDRRRTDDRRPRRTAPPPRRRLDDHAATTTPHPPPIVADRSPGDVVARIEIPSIGLDAKVVAGVTPEDLKKGPGHYPDTPMPGQLGNAAIAGHRTTYGQPFSGLDERPARRRDHPDDRAGTLRLPGDRREVVPPPVRRRRHDRPDGRPAHADDVPPAVHGAQRLIVYADLDAAASAAPRRRHRSSRRPPSGGHAAGDDAATTTPAPSTTAGTTDATGRPTVARRRRPATGRRRADGRDRRRLRPRLVQRRRRVAAGRAVGHAARRHLRRRVPAQPRDPPQLGRRAGRHRPVRRRPLLLLPERQPCSPSPGARTDHAVSPRRTSVAAARYRPPGPSPAEQVRVDREPSSVRHHAGRRPSTTSSRSMFGHVDRTGGRSSSIGAPAVVTTIGCAISLRSSVGGMARAASRAPRTRRTPPPTCSSNPEVEVRHRWRSYRPGEGGRRRPSRSWHRRTATTSCDGWSVAKRVLGPPGNH